MIYYVTNTPQFFEEDLPYKICTIEESLSILEPLKIVGLDSETIGMEIWQGKLKLLQLGNKENQVVIDCETINLIAYKEYLESNRLFIIHNAKFDLRWLYKEKIVVRNVYDTFLAEKILYLGFPPGIISLSLQACCDRYLGIYLDKSVRGEIYRGITDQVIIYAANDVIHLEDIMEAQLITIRLRNQETALDIENEFVKVLAYIEYSGIKLDADKWKLKMKNDEQKLKEAEDKLNKWVIDYVLSKNDPSLIFKDYSIGKKKAKKTKDLYVSIDPQGDLFSGMNNEPKCIINWNSSSQVIPLLLELGFDLLTKDKKTGKMKYSVDMSIINKQKSISTISELYIEYSKAFKTVTSFGQNFLDAINPVTGRIHPTFNQMMDTGRTSCGSGGKKGGGKSKDDDIAEEDKTDEIIKEGKSVNIQQLPADEVTRSCFIPELGNLLSSIDYGDQEGHIFTELSNDIEWIKFYNDPRKRDGHSFVAKMVFSEELKDIPEEEVSKKRPDLRQDAKPCRFTFNYNGTPNALAANTGKPLDFCIKVYNTYFEAFYGIKDYFKIQKRLMWERGYILISEYTGLRAYIYDYPILKGIERRKNSMDNFWDLYRESKNSGKVITDLPNSVKHQIVEKFSKNEPLEAIAIRYSYKIKKGNKVEEKFIDINRETVIITSFNYLNSRRSASENQSCNYTSQGQWLCINSLNSGKAEMSILSQIF